ncbi:MAG: hypothetical protein IPJ19_18725 [Planctomycetes bacterium]|nr:hypothetical protein [Planctomycetota bacterium]
MSNPASIALALGDVEQGLSCAGTALECRSFLVKKQAFLFLSEEHLRLKLGRSVAQAKKRGVAVGAAGWIKLDLDDLPPQPMLKAWIAESYALFAGKDRAKAPASKPKAAPKRGSKR